MTKKKTENRLFSKPTGLVFAEFTRLFGKPLDRYPKVAVRMVDLDEVTVPVEKLAVVFED